MIGLTYKLHARKEDDNAGREHCYVWKARKKIKVGR